AHDDAHLLVAPPHAALRFLLLHLACPPRTLGPLLLLPQDGREAGAVPPRLAHLDGVVELADGPLAPPPAELLAALPPLGPGILHAHLPDHLGLHDATPTPRRVTNLVLMESLWAASRSASRASLSGMPSIS